MGQPQTTKEGLNIASSYTKTFFFEKVLRNILGMFFVHSMNKMNHFSQPIKYLVNFYEIIYGGCILFCFEISLKFRLFFCQLIVVKTHICISYY
jgi:hypothetical protein